VLFLVCIKTRFAADAFQLLLPPALLVLVGAYGFLKYTYIGQDNYDIRRLRTSLDPNNASLHVRLVNQARLAEYLNSHPFGGGVGAGGFWGNRFKPGSFLADLALDSWYVRIASDYGWFGLAYYLIMILYFIFSGFFVVFRMNDEGFRQQLAAIYAGMVGVAVASYGNQVWGQMPTGIIIYIILAFLSVVPMKYKHLYSKPKLA
jgi:cell division protein FtsW (lipid II flippase)